MIRNIEDLGSNTFNVENVVSDFDTKAAAALDAITSDIAILDGSPTNAAVIAVVRRTLVRQRAIVKAIWKLADEVGLS